jgi:long-subunit fatty acid transport protein
MKKILLLLFLSVSLLTCSQQKSDFWKNVRFGGGFSLGFGTRTTIGISPSAVYDFNKGFSLGAGLNYIYSEFGTISTNLYGGSIISLYQVPVIGIQLSGEFEHSFAKQKDASNSSTINTDFPALYLGAAYNKGRFSFGLRYDVLYDENKSVYASPFSPIVRFYF